MKQQIFLTYRSEPLSRWREAFPSADIQPYPGPGMVLAQTPGSAVVWLHVQPEKIGVGERVAQVRAMCSGCPVVVLSNMPSSEEGLAALAAGAAGYCSALAIPALLRQVSVVVEQGGLWVGQELMRRLFGAVVARASEMEKPSLAVLSPRERQVALAVAQGGTNKEIARAMGVTERTVKAHLSAIFEKLGVRDRLQLSLVVNGVESPASVRVKVSA
jgi:DNA-binding NarL/FixJ family response regulator